MYYVDPNAPTGRSQTAHSVPQKIVDPSQALIKTSEAANSLTVVKLEKIAEQLDTAARRLTDQEQHLGRSYMTGHKRKLSATDDPEGEQASKRVFSNSDHAKLMASIRNNPPKLRSRPPK